MVSSPAAPKQVEGVLFRLASDYISRQRRERIKTRRAIVSCNAYRSLSDFVLTFIERRRKAIEDLVLKSAALPTRWHGLLEAEMNAVAAVSARVGSRGTTLHARHSCSYD